MIQCVEDLKEPPVVGRYYMVPCVEVQAGVSGLSPGFWPVTGPQHEDHDVIGFPHRHWHFDFRFLSAEQAKQKAMQRGSVLTTERNTWRPWHRQDGPGDIEGIPGIAMRVTLQRRRCMRAAERFPRLRAEWMRALEQKHEGCVVKCGKCPHRGLPLESLPREKGDIVTCPGHGLRWDLKTGKLVTT